MNQISLRVVTPEAEIGTVPLPLEEEGASCSVHLRRLPGTTAIHLAFTDGQGNVISRAEVEAKTDEPVPLQIALGPDREMQVWSPGRRVLTLPPEHWYEPPPPIPPPAPGAGLDLVFIIDATARHFELRDNRYVSAPLVGPGSKTWEEHVDMLLRFAEPLVHGSNGSRIAVLAFGDEELGESEAQEPKPKPYLLRWPEDKREFSTSPEWLEDALKWIEPTPGGDFVDALADALHECRRLPWRKANTRKIVMICGDSPGHSVLHPLCRGADIHVRQLDVDVEAEHLQREGVEIVTLYFDPPPGLERQPEFLQELIQGAREQYERLASLPSMAFKISGFDDPVNAAEGIKTRQGMLGRRSAPGELVEIRP